jgi:hypothetical protein
MLYIIATRKPLLFLFLFLFFIFSKIYQNMGKKLGSNNTHEQNGSVKCCHRHIVETGLNS